jgi:hypothetical protein
MMEQWNRGLEEKKMPIRALVFLSPLFQLSNIPLFGTTGGTARGGTASAGRAGGALKFSAARKGKGRHRPVNFLALTFRAGNLLRSIQY